MSKAAKLPPIKDLARFTDHIVDAMHNNCPSWSVDTLNAHPLEAIRIYAVAAKSAGRLTNAQHRAITKWLEACPLMVGNATATFNPIHEAARAALASRKRGDLKLDRY